MRAQHHDAANLDAAAKLKSYLERQLLVEFGSEVDESSDLFRLGLIDSYAYIEVLRFIESEFQVSFTEEEMLLEVEVSLAGLAALAERKMAQAA